jgi:hypothetical protein
MTSLSPFRYRLSLEACSPAMKPEARGRDGRLFQDWRVRLGLGVQEVADGWGVDVKVLDELERGGWCFVAPADAWSALQQLFLWACERHGYFALGQRGR